MSISMVLGLSSCDEASVVGIDVQPEGDLLNIKFNNETVLVTETMTIDSMRTDEDFHSSSVALLGNYTDPVFGKTTSSIYTQLGLSANISSTSFGKSPVFDRIVLSLVYDGTESCYGKKNNRAEQKVNVYQLNDDQEILRSGIYYSDTSLSHSALDLANGFTFTPDPNDTVLRIPLNALFGQILLNNQSTGVLASNTAFQEFLKGLYITTENTSGLSSGEGNIIRFRMDESKMTLYYHNDTSNSSFIFNLNGVARFLNFSHNYTSGIHPALATQINGTTGDDSSIAFIQGMGGLKVKISTPQIMSLLDSGAIGINKAELVVKEYIGSGDPGIKTIPPTPGANYYFSPFTNYFAAPPKLVLGGTNEDGTAYDLPDFNEGSSYYGGVYNAATKEYRFNIARYIQQVLDGSKANNGLFLIIPPLTANQNANRVIIGGGSPSPFQMKLNITYTKLH